jgi:glutamine amidotransferase
MIAIIDYGMGNLRSVQKAFEVCGAKPKITDKPGDIEKADKIILPGVGAFWAAMQELGKRRLIAPIKEKIASGAPYLGLCLGLQLLFDDSEEGRTRSNVRGLGILPGTVKLFKGKLKVPHMGWNDVEFLRSNPLFKGIESGEKFYFVHSYYAVPKEKNVVLTQTPYGGRFCSAVWKDNIFATQFHPEKSQSSGLKVIRNFIRL